MDNSTECLACKSKNTKKSKAKFAGFIAERVFDGSNCDIELIHCQDCGFAYYSHRFSEEEGKKLYLGYRDETYQKQRQSHECWYSKEINELIGKNKTELKNRHGNLISILKKNLDVSNISSVLDFGGDKGQFIPELSKSTKKYVYDISEIEPLDGVISLGSLDECRTHQYNLILCAHVLEHVSNPIEIVKQLKSLMNKGQYLYVELPFDSPFYKNKFSDLQFVFNRYFSWITLFKHFLQARKNANLHMMHEHINYFTPKSLKNILENEGFKMLHNETKTIDSKWCKSQIISTLCVLGNN